jgi:hypothetical protein
LEIFLKNPKKIIRTPNLPIRTKTFPKHTIFGKFSTLKKKGAKNSYGGYPAEFAGSTQNPKKIIGTPNFPIKKKIFPIKVCLVP